MRDDSTTTPATRPLSIVPPISVEELARRNRAAMALLAERESDVEGGADQRETVEILTHAGPIPAPDGMGDPKSLRYPSVDSSGRILPLDADWAAFRAAEALRALEIIDEMGDEEEQRATFEALMAGLDESRLSRLARSGE